MPGLSVFFPAYNDGGTIASLVMMSVAKVKEKFQSTFTPTS